MLETSIGGELLTTYGTKLMRDDLGNVLVRTSFFLLKLGAIMERVGTSAFSNPEKW